MRTQESKLNYCSHLKSLRWQVIALGTFYLYYLIAGTCKHESRCQDLVSICLWSEIRAKNVILLAAILNFKMA